MQKIDKTDTLETILTRGKFEVDYYQREYRWGRKQIEHMLHMLARLTDYVTVRMGLASQFENYVDRNPKTSYDIEHKKFLLLLFEHGYFNAKS